MDIKFMQMAIQLAKEAELNDEVPVGAVIVRNGEVLGVGRNRKEELLCAVRHAEIEAIENACRNAGNWYLDNTEIYITLEPCPMCAGAIINSRIEKIYFGAYDKKAGCCGTLMNLPEDARFNHRAEVVGGIMETECAEMLTRFFRSKRQ